MVIFLTSPGANVNVPPPVVETRVVDKVAAWAENGRAAINKDSKRLKDVSFFKKFGIMPFQYNISVYVRR